MSFFKFRIYLLNYYRAHLINNIFHSIINYFFPTKVGKKHNGRLFLWWQAISCQKPAWIYWTTQYFDLLFNKIFRNDLNYCSGCIYVCIVFFSKLKDCPLISVSNIVWKNIPNFELALSFNLKWRRINFESPISVDRDKLSSAVFNQWCPKIFFIRISISFLENAIPFVHKFELRRSSIFYIFFVKVFY